MSIGLIGRKVGMTQVFQDDGTMVAVSVLAIEPNTVTRLRTTDRDGYTAVQLGSEPAKKLSKPEAGQLKSLPKGAQTLATLREFRVDNVDDYEVGQTVSIEDLFAAGDNVDVSGVSKGKGFAGHIKRHNFKRGPKTHGSDHHREPGSIGPGTTPGRVYKGVRMAGHMGDDTVTIKKVRVVRTDPERNLLLVKGTSPRRARLAHPGEEGLTMPSTPLYDRTGKTVGNVELSDELFAAPVNTAVLHQVVTAQLAARRIGTHATRTRGEVRGGGQQALPSEGHRPRPAGLAERTALPRWRGRLRATPALVRAAAAAQDEAPRAARCAHREARRRPGQGHRWLRPRCDEDPGARRRPQGTRGERSRARSSRPGATRTSSCRRATCRPST